MKSSTCSCCAGGGIRGQYQVSSHNDPNGKPRTDGQGRLNVKIAADDLLACLVQSHAATLTKGLHDRVVITVGTQLRAHAQDRREECRAEQPAPMMVHL